MGHVERPHSLQAALTQCPIRGMLLRLAPTLTRTHGPPAPPLAPPLLQAFNWESCKQPWYKVLAGEVQEMKREGFTAVWMPPPSDAVSEQVG